MVGDMEKYSPYPEYQSSGTPWLGDLPKGWRALRGKNVFAEINERSQTGDETLLSVSEYYGVKPRTQTLDADEHLTRAESLVGYKIVKQDDLAMNIMLAWKRGLGVSKFDGIVSPAYSVFRFFENAVPKFMHYLLRTDAYTGHFKSRSTGVIDSRLRLYPEAFADVHIVCPPVETQTQIAAFLDHETAKIDDLIAKQQRLITLLEEKRQAVISQAVTKGLNPKTPMRPSGVDWLGDVPAHWEIRTVRGLVRSQHLEIQDGNHGELHPVAAEYVTHGIPFLMANNVQGGEIDTQNCNFIELRRADKLRIGFSKPGDLLLTHKGTVGEVGIVPDDIGTPYWMLTPQVTYYRWAKEKYLNQFFLLAFQSNYFQTQLKILGSIQATRAYIGLIAQGDLILAIPPLSEQKKIVEALSDYLPTFEKIHSNVASAITLLQERRTALISAAVTGKIDVRDWRAPANTTEGEAA